MLPNPLSQRKEYKNEKNKTKKQTSRAQLETRKKKLK